ncbi:MAG TPA: hypothetical protein VGO47_04485 [Chlamydiales bacterium]|nr:hypothetical protein [Chlamydiales bacterium]
MQQLAMETEDWHTLPEEDIEQMKHCLEEYRASVAKGSRSQGRAVSQDVAATCKQVAETVWWFCALSYSNRQADARQAR